MDNNAKRDLLKIDLPKADLLTTDLTETDLPNTRDVLKAFLTDQGASLPLQYATLAAVSGIATALAARAIGNDIAGRLDAIQAALMKSGSGALLH